MAENDKKPSLLAKFGKTLEMVMDSYLEKAKTNNKSEEAAWDRRGLIDLGFETEQQNGWIEKRGLVGPDILKNMARKDSIIVAIRRTRLAQASRFAKPQKDKYSPGWLIRPVKPADLPEEDKLTMNDPDTKSDKEASDKLKAELDAKRLKLFKKQEKEIEHIKQFLINCGNEESKDSFDFGKFISIIIDDRLTYNYSAIELIPTKDRSSIARFYPVSAHGIRYVAKDSSDRYKKVIQEQFKKEGKVFVDDGEPFKYLQLVRGRVTAAWTDSQLIFEPGIPTVDPEDMGYCYLPESLWVTTLNDGVKLIEDMEKGDFVIGADGTINEVSGTSSRFIDEIVYHITPYGQMPHKVTGNHPLAICKEGKTAKDYVRFNLDKAQPEWTRAENVEVGDYMAVPRVKLPEVFTHLDVPSFVEGFEVENGYVYAGRTKKHKIPEVLEIDEDFAWMLGLYLGDGTVMSDKTLRFDLGIGENDTVTRLERIAAKYKATCTVKKGARWENMQSVYLYSRVLTQIVAKLCPGKLSTKKLTKPLFAMRKASKLAFIEGLIESDGAHCIRNFKNDISVLRISSTSASIAYGVALLANSLGALAKVKYEVRGGKFGTCKIFEVNVPPSLYEGRIVKSKKVLPVKNHSHLANDDFFFVKIRKVKKKHYSGVVCNIHVKNEPSFIGNGMATHNSPGELEQLIQIVTAHLYAEAHNRNFFTQGLGTKGLLHIKGDNITRAQLEAFKRTWFSQVVNTRNAFRPPIIGLADEVKWIELSQSNKDMEFDNWMTYLIRIATAVYNIDPAEINFDISKVKVSTLNESSSDSRMKASKDKGLNTLLDYVENIVNDKILKRWNPELAAKYKFAFVGLDAESRQEEIERLKSEVQVWKTVNEARIEMGRHPIEDGDIILAATYTQYKAQKDKFETEKITAQAGNSNDANAESDDNDSYFSELNSAIDTASKPKEEPEEAKTEDTKKSITVIEYHEADED